MLEPKGDPTRFFILTPLPEGGSAHEAMNCKGLTIAIGRVELPPYLNTQKIVTFSSTDEVVLSEFNRWAEPLDSGFARVLALNIRELTGVSQIEFFPWIDRDRNDFEVFTEVHAFEATPDGTVELRVSWSITTGNAQCLLFSGNDVFMARSDGSYPSIVSAMSAAVGRYSERISQALTEASKKKLKQALSQPAPSASTETGQAADEVSACCNGCPSKCSPSCPDGCSMECPLDSGWIEQ
jgi:hypothetical protein